jgi:predicted dehydrogenase
MARHKKIFNTPSGGKAITRRGFLWKASLGAAGVLGVPYFVPSSVFGRGGSPAPSERIAMGCIGVGWQGGNNLRHLLEQADARVTAVCDVDRRHLQETQEHINKTYQSKDCAAYHDFRELIARDDIDAVSIALPDHWHAVAAIQAARAGKDIYGEKPLSHSLLEGRAICDAVARYGRIWQTGSWQRSWEHFRFACELVRNGRIGRVHTMQVGMEDPNEDLAGTKDQTVPCPPPAELDYEFWLGPAPWSPYCPARLHKNWRWNLDTGGGILMDWVGHHVDIAHWGMGLDNSGPVEIEARGEFPPASAVWNAPEKYRITARYAEGITMFIACGDNSIAEGTRWIGDKGWIYVNRRKLDANPQSLLKEKIGPDEIHLYRSPGHTRNFLDCIKTRRPTITPAETAHRSATPGHLGLIALKLGRKLRFNPKTEEIIGDPTASSMLGNAMRSPWNI